MLCIYFMNYIYFYRMKRHAVHRLLMAVTIKSFSKHGSSSSDYVDGEVGKDYIYSSESSELYYCRFTMRLLYDVTSFSKR